MIANGQTTTDTKRVAVREIRETTWRALVACGVSAGEANVAAEAVAACEVFFQCGLEVVARELAAATFDRIPIGLERGPVCILRDLSGRGLLRMAPPAIGLVLANDPQTATVFIPNGQWHPLLAGFLLSELGQPYANDADIMAVEIGHPNETTRSVRVCGEGVTFATSAEELTTAELGPGVLITQWSPSDRPRQTQSTMTVDDLEQHLVLAERRGVDIATDRWRPVGDVAEKFLVSA